MEVMAVINNTRDYRSLYRARNMIENKSIVHTEVKYDVS